jgi:hypothetical protein
MVSGHDVAHDQIFITVGHLRSSCCGAPSLTRRIYNLFLQFAVTLGSKSRRTRGHILLSHLRLPQPGGPGTGWPSYSSGHWVRFFRLLLLSGIAIRLRTGLTNRQVKVQVILRPTVSRPVRISVVPLTEQVTRFYVS